MDYDDGGGRGDDEILDHVIALSLAYHEIEEERSSKGKTPIGISVSHSPPSTSATTTSSSAVITCDLCHEPKLPSQCFLDMLGCTHLPCFVCFDPDSDSSQHTTPCPVPGCCRGFFLSSVGAAEVDKTTPTPDFYCNICMEFKSPSETFFDMKGCTHVFCSDCIAQYVAAKVEENVVAIACPDTGCTAGFLEPEACRPILPQQVFLQWGAGLCESSIAGPMKFYCLYKDCSALLLNDVGPQAGGGGEELITESACPHCGRRFCAQCKVPWHEGFKCKEYQKLEEGERGREDLMLTKMAEKSRWQRCPNCGFFVERVDGCIFIRCRCKHCFCYLCAAPMDIEDSKHYCSKCKRTWDSK